MYSLYTSELFYKCCYLMHRFIPQSENKYVYAPVCIFCLLSIFHRGFVITTLKRYLRIECEISETFIAIVKPRAEIGRKD